MAFRDFAAARAETAREPVAFSLAGEHFDCLPQGAIVVSGALVAFAAADSLTVDTSTKFVRDVLDAGHEERFDKLLARKHEPVDRDTVVMLALWLVEVYTGRPILRSPDSPSGSSTAGSTSTDSSPAPDADSSTSLPESSAT